MLATKISITVFMAALLVVSQVACGRSSRSTPQPVASPTPDVVAQILEKYVEAIGGQDAIDHVKSYETRGRFATSLVPLQGNFQMWGKDPNKTLSVIEFPRIGTLRKGFDGETRWVQTPIGTFTDRSPEEMAALERDADVYNAGKIANLYETLRYDSKARLSGHDVYVLEGKPPKGVAEKLFFNAESGLLERWDMARRDPKRGTIFVKVHLDDYRDVDGVKVPFKIRFVFESFEVLLQVDELKHNVPIDDSVFRKP